MPCSHTLCYLFILIFRKDVLLTIDKWLPQNHVIPELCIRLDWGELEDENPVKHIVRLTQGSDGYTAQAGNLLFNSPCQWVSSHNECRVNGRFSNVRVFLF